MIEIYLLEQLEAFARNGTLLAASEELHITQPALSRNMKKLEEEFGVSLFHRENSKISLNKNGKLAVEYARKVLEDDQDKDAVTYTLNPLRLINPGRNQSQPQLDLHDHLLHFKERISDPSSGSTWSIRSVMVHFYNASFLTLTYLLLYIPFKYRSCGTAQLLT